MNISLVIASVLALFRVIRVRRSGVVRTSLVAFVCLLLGTACEVVMIFIEEFGLDDPCLLVGVTAQITTQTAIEAFPFTGGVIGAQYLRQWIKV